MELRDCSFNEKGEIVCEEVNLSLETDDSDTPVIIEGDKQLKSGVKKYSELPSLDKKVV